MSHKYFGTAAIISALGFLIHSVNSAQAQIGPSVNYDQNPIISTTGVHAANGNTNTTIVTAPSDQDIIITDVSLDLSSVHYYCETTIDALLTTNLGQDLARYTIIRTTSGHERPSHTMRSGLRLASGESLELNTNQFTANSYCPTVQITYSISGYYARP